MNVRRRASALVIFVIAGLALAGCGHSPLAPGASSQNPGPASGSLTPPIPTFAANGAVDYVWAPVGTASQGVSRAGTVGALSVSSTVKIDGSRGGTVKAGRFSVKLPAGAFSGPATVTISMADSTVMICNLSITPQSANKFKSPAELTADLGSPSLTDASAFTMYWYDPVRLTWVNLFYKSKVAGSLISTSLDHFSTYAAGKAGW